MCRKTLMQHFYLITLFDHDIDVDIGADLHLAQGPYLSTRPMPTYKLLFSSFGKPLGKVSFSSCY